MPIKYSVVLEFISKVPLLVHLYTQERLEFQSTGKLYLKSLFGSSILNLIILCYSKVYLSHLLIQFEETQTILFPSIWLRKGTISIFGIWIFPWEALSKESHQKHLILRLNNIYTFRIYGIQQTNERYTDYQELPY